jgi:ABC-2 type transport system permease protein
MAGIELTPEVQLAIPRESEQFRALVEMRWRLFTRTMRNDTAKINFALWLTGRIVIFGLALGAGVFAAFMAYLACAEDGAPGPGKVFFFLMLFWQGLSLLRDQASGGVEGQLLRFPLRLRTYIALWLSAGLLEGMTIIGTLACIGLYVGMVVAGVNFFRAGIAVLLFLFCNLMLSRNITLWMGRLLARRRTREIVLLLFSLISILPRFMRSFWTETAALLHRLPLPPWVFSAVHALPPSLAARTAFGNTAAALNFLGLFAWSAALAASLIIGLRRSFRGEHLQEFAAASEPKRLARTAAKHAAAGNSHGSHPAFVVAQMEWARLRHGGAALYGTFTPLIYVAIFGLRLARTSVGFWTLPIVCAYLALTLRAYNIFGTDGPGVQTFMLLPIPLRDIALGKNLFAAAIFMAQVCASAILVGFVAHRTSAPALLFTAIWAAGHMAVNFAIGNARSVRVPTRVSIDRTVVRGARSNSTGGGWIALTAIFASSVVGAIIVAICIGLHQPWLAPVGMLPFSAAAAIWYHRSLNSPALQGNIQSMEPLGLILAKTA